MPTTDGTDRKRRTRRTEAEVPAPNTTHPPGPERGLVDIDPWAMLLEGLMEAPEENAPPGRERGKRR